MSVLGEHPVTRRRPPLVLVGVAIVWLGIWIYLTRYAMLDDALIHLRYADYLERLHYLTYDGVHRTFGSSSLLYVGLLALLRVMDASPLLPKFVSLIGYLILIGIVAWRSAHIGDSRARVMSLGLLVCLLSPMGIRWLTDGMETSVVLVASVLLVLVIDQRTDTNRAGYSGLPLLMLCGCFLVLLRVELASLALVAAFILISQPQVGAARKWRILEAVSICAGAGIALAGVYHAFGSILPDTAVAKSAGPSLEPLFATIQVILSAVLLGAGTALIWIVSGVLLWLAYRQSAELRQHLASFAVANGILPLVVALACLRGQDAQGVRYVLWCLVFSAFWNILQLDGATLRPPRRGEYAKRLQRQVLVLTLGMLVCALPLDWHYAWRAMRGRSETFAAMRNADLQVFAEKPVIAGDIGFVGYFSNGAVCDLLGLVNGRRAAQLPVQERIRICVAQHPEMLFLNDRQAWALHTEVNLEEWMVCQHYDFPNVRGNDRHYLLVRNQDVAKYCPKLKGPLGPPAQLIPGLVASR